MIIEQGEADARERLQSMLRSDPRRLRRRSISLGVPIDEADDAAQIAALRARRSIDGLHATGEGGMCAWLDVIARRVAIDLSRARRVEVEPDADLRSPQDVEGETDVCRRLSLTLRAIRDLPAELREPLILSVVEDRSAPEIAAELGLTPATVRQRISRGRRILRAATDASHSAGSLRPSS